MEILPDFLKRNPVFAVLSPSNSGADGAGGFPAFLY